MGLKEKIAKIGNNLKNVIQSIIDPKQMREIARETGFIKRCSSRIDGDEFVKLLLIESIDGSKNTLRGAIDTLGEINSKVVMSIQALGKRINSEAAAIFIEKVFERTLHVALDRLNHAIEFPKKQLHLLRFFSNVFLQDSSECLLDPSLKDEFKGSSGGSGNGIGDASVKVDLIYEYKAKALMHFKVTDRREPDSVLGNKILEVIKKGDLVIRDLGYSCISIFEQIQEAGAYFLSRLHSIVTVYLHPSDTQYISLGSFLEKKVNKCGVVDLMVYISKRMFQCRMIAYRAPPEIEKQRRKEYLKECKKRKRKPDKEYIKRLAFTIFITNVPSTIWNAEIVGTIYRLRWQVELIFKSWKSNLKFDFLAGTNVFRIKCLIYARLTAILMMFTVYSFVDKVALETLEKEASIHKVIDWLTRNGRFFEIVMSGFTKNLWNTLKRSCERILYKEKRKDRRTTRELVEEMVSFGCVSC